MGKVDVFAAIDESFGLIRARYKEVIAPLILLLIIMGGMSQSFSSFYRGLIFTLPGSETMAIAYIVFFILFYIALIITSSALRFYIAEHFYAALAKRKIEEGWKSRFSRMAAKSVVLLVFGAAVFALILAVPVLALFSSNELLQTPLNQFDISQVIAVVGLFLAAILANLAVMFFLSPMWIYYALDKKGFLESIKLSVSLVKSNIKEFIIFSVVFILLGIGASALGLLLICLPSSLGMIALNILIIVWGDVSLMKIKLGLEK